MKIITLFLSLMTFVLLSSGCASIASGWKSLISGGEDTSKITTVSSTPTYSKQSNMVPGAYRDYKRTTRKTMSDAAQLDAKTGSLWVMEGQGAYLFSQNIVRLIGDPISVRIEGDSKDQLNQKAVVISDLLAQLEARRKNALMKQENQLADAKAQKTTDAPAAPQNDANRGPASEKDKLGVKIVPTRVVERLVDGNYRVRGAQSFMIGSREYKVIVSGVVRAEDFNEQGIDSNQLLDSNFDIVSSRGSEVR
jgi:flagellar L-ring protein precursor FlgH